MAVRIVRKRVGQQPEVAEIDAGLDAMQAEVGGMIEPIRLTEEVAIYVNEEGILLGLPSNTVLRNSAGRAVFSLVGDLFVGANDEEGDSRSLTDDEVSFALRVLGAK